MATKILLGPVLSFRGVSQGKWKVSALIGIDEGDKAPKVIVDGKAAPKSSATKKLKIIECTFTSFSNLHLRN